MSTRAALIDGAWPVQRRGIVPQNTADVVNNIQTHLAIFEPATEGQKTLAADAYREFSRLIELRRMRLKSVTGGLPASLWSVLLIGGFLNVAVTWFFHMKSQSMHFWMTVMFASLLGYNDLPDGRSGSAIPGTNQHRPRSV